MTIAAEKKELTPKARRTRAQILNTALGLFAEKGYQATTMRDIAAAAGCSLGLAYRYFGSKEELVIAVYEQCSEDLTAEVQSLPPTTIAKRFIQTVRTNFNRLAPHRESFGAITGLALNPYSDAGVLSERMSYLRARVLKIFREVLTGAKDAPNDRDVDNLSTLFYACYLLLMLFWVQDRSASQENTSRLLKFTEENLGRMRPLLKLPVVTRSLASMAKILSPMFGA